MQSVRLLIVDHSEIFANDVMSYLGRMPGIDIVGFQTSGERAVEYIMEDAPDAVLLELILDGLDGISVLKSIRGMEKPPACIVCTEFFNEVCIRRARQFGASSFLCKPVRRQSLYDAIIESVNAMGDALMECDIPIVEPRKARATAIADYLAARGIPRQSYGFRFLCDAVTISRQNPGALTAVTKSLYPEIARVNESTPARVERDIRSAILHAYRHSNLRVNGARPTNREFIQLLADQSFDSVELI